MMHSFDFLQVQAGAHITPCVLEWDDARFALKRAGGEVLFETETSAAHRSLDIFDLYVDSEIALTTPNGKLDLGKHRAASVALRELVALAAQTDREFRAKLDEQGKTGVRRGFRLIGACAIPIALHAAWTTADLPLPAMIDVDLAPSADPVAVGQRIEAAAPGARFVAHADSLAPLLGALRSLSWLAVGLVLLVALANAAVVVLATRSALDTNRATIEILHGIGATDTQIAHLFQRRIAIDALIGGIGGGIAAGIVMVLLLGTGSGWVADLAGGTLLHGRDMALLALLPLLVAIMATVVARIAVLSTLRATL